MSTYFAPFSVLKEQRDHSAGSIPSTAGCMRSVTYSIHHRSCKRGYYFLASSKTCASCGSGLIYRMGLSLTFLLVIIACTVYFFRKDHRTLQTSSFRGSLKILFTTFQILSFINVDLALPGLLQNVSLAMEFLQVCEHYSIVVASHDAQLDPSSMGVHFNLELLSQSIHRFTCPTRPLCSLLDYLLYSDLSR